MTVATLKNYLKSLKFGGAAADPMQNEIVDAAAEAAFAKVWEAYIWRIGKKFDTSLSTTASQAYTILPDDLSGIGALTLTKGNDYQTIDIQSDDNFDYNFPNPASWGNATPTAAKLVFNSPQQANRWYLYWDRIPDAVYTLRLSYRPVWTLANLPQLPGHMIEPIMLVASVLILPPGPAQNNQMAAARVSLMDAIAKDTKFVGGVGPIGGDPQWDSYSNASRGGDVWDPHSA